MSEIADLLLDKESDLMLAEHDSGHVDLVFLVRRRNCSPISSNSCAH